jgi:hypothetical protein
MSVQVPLSRDGIGQAIYRQILPSVPSEVGRCSIGTVDTVYLSRVWRIHVPKQDYEHRPFPKTSADCHE